MDDWLEPRDSSPSHPAARRSDREMRLRDALRATLPPGRDGKCGHGWEIGASPDSPARLYLSCLCCERFFADTSYAALDATRDGYRALERKPNRHLCPGCGGRDEIIEEIGTLDGVVRLTRFG